MTQAQLIEVTETILYMKDGIIVSEPKTDNEKLLHSIFGETKVMKSESVIERWNLKRKKDADVMFWNFITDNNKDSRNYYVVFTS
jgi:hypothetical protein